MRILGPNTVGVVNTAINAYQTLFAAEQRNGCEWAPGKLLERLAREGKGWADA